MTRPYDVGAATAVWVVIYGRRPEANKLLHDFLSQRPDVVRVDVTINAEEAVRAVRAGANALLVDTGRLMDPQVPELLEALAHMANSTPVVLLGVPAETVAITRAVVTGPVGIATGAPLSASFGRAVERVAGGAAPMPEEILAPFLSHLVAERRQNEADAATLAALTNRELTVLRLLSEGQRRGEIAEQLGLSPNTVRTHLANLMHKLGTHTQLTTAMRGRQLLGLERPAVIRLPEDVRTPG